MPQGWVGPRGPPPTDPAQGPRRARRRQSGPTRAHTALRPPRWDRPPESHSEGLGQVAPHPLWPPAPGPCGPGDFSSSNPKPRDKGPRLSNPQWGPRRGGTGGPHHTCGWRDHRAGISPRPQSRNGTADDLPSGACFPEGSDPSVAQVPHTCIHTYTHNMHYVHDVHYIHTYMHACMHACITCMHVMHACM